MVERSLQGIVITDHDYLWDVHELRKLKRDASVSKSFVIMAGQEIEVPRFGHILIYGANETVDPGVIGGIIGADQEVLKKVVSRAFEKKGDEIVAKNLEALKKGYSLGKKFKDEEELDIGIEPDDQIKDDVILSGGEAVSLGAIAGGCNFISSYPMSPSTAVLVFLSQHAEDFGIVAEQAEDEISAMNMALGAWYAGARAMVTTSGGGFALMAEALSLAGMIESPMVIHLAQRPGPATGLPTRTEQADLLFALRAGHGEFPRIILSPGSLEEAFYLSQKAFNLADELQVPVFILTDQFFIDTYYNLPQLDVSDLEINKAFVETDPDYKRFKVTEDGISPRGIPGHGKGLVCLDSDEHDEFGRITEDMHTRVNMVDKRTRKMKKIEKASLEPKLIGSSDFKTLVVGWGSTLELISEAVNRIGNDEVTQLHFNQVYPLHHKVKGLLEKANKIVIVEGNSQSQLGTILKLEAGIEADHSILKYSGLPFSVEELERKISEVL
jgi:2-oxoglutarate ferredoxin oxidoreductase subunit alpha